MAQQCRIVSDRKRQILPASARELKINRTIGRARTRGDATSSWRLWVLNSMVEAAQELGSEMESRKESTAGADSYMA